MLIKRQDKYIEEAMLQETCIIIFHKYERDHAIK